MKILVIRFSSIGDIVLTSPVLRALKQQKNAEIHFLTKEKFRELVEFSPYIDCVYTIKHSTRQLVSQLQREKYDLIIDLHQNLRSRWLSFILRVRRIGFNKLNFAKWILVNFKKDVLPKKHLIDRYFEALEVLNIHNDGQGLDFFLNPASQLLNEPLPPIVGVLSATYTTKKIPLQLWQNIITNLKSKIVLIGGEKERELGIALQNMFPESCLNKAGAWTLQQSAKCIAEAELVITGDTGMMHIAAAFKKRMHVFWGSTVPEFGMFPYYPADKLSAVYHEVKNLPCRPCSKLGYNTCPKLHFKCMVDQVTSIE